ncbi:MAG TPA: LytTR family DNA-binding domain-containing protein [Thermoanaerobaculia bacterium]|nr:LytTR family DNA-binding domain-containing protein [Thermoanaerobaculia bacterium]
MSPIRALIADDEPLARTRIRLLLKDHPDVEVVAECSNGREAAQLMRQEKPGLLFLDIEMPDLGGFDALEETAGMVEPVVIFVTAHEEFALDAFEANAVDYLVKPFDQERFDRALTRARRFLALRPTPPHNRPSTPQPARIRERFAVRGRGQIVFVKAANIEWIGAEGNYARLYTREGSYLIRESLQHLEETLDPATFVRVHRSAIVNIERVGKLVPGPEGTYSIVLQNEVAIPLGPTFRTRLESLLGQKL